jgi:tetratricopeptide (TPR) repeat protein
VRKAGNQVRITAQLIDAKRDVHLWSETWDRTLEDVFAIQDEIANSVVDELKVTLLGAAPESVETNPDVYNLYLQGRHLERQGSKESMLKAVELFEQALEIDPEYAPAWDGLCVAYTNLAGSRAIPREDGYAKAREAAERALDIDSDNPHALNGLGFIASQHDGDYEAAARYISRALQLAPNDDRVLNSAAVLLQDLNRNDEALRIYKLLVRRDPVNPTTYHNLAIAQYSAGNLDAAAATLDQSLTLSADMILASWWRAFMHCAQEEFEACLAGYESLADKTGQERFRVLGQASAYPGLGREAEGAAALAELERIYVDDFPYIIASLHARRGNTEVALDWFEKAYELDGRAGIGYVTRDPQLAFLLDEPRMQALLEIAGLSQEELDAVEFNVDLPG